MIVQCIENHLEKACNGKPSDILHKTLGRIEDILQKDKCYVVYSLFEAPDFKWYLLKHSSGRQSPLWLPNVFFKIIDPKPSQYWMTFWKYSLEGGEGIGMLYAFPEYAERDGFYSNLTDRREEEVEIFNDYIKKIRDEAIL
jgi:hypothetical protein